MSSHGTTGGAATDVAAPPAHDSTLLVVDDLVKNYGAVHAVQHASFHCLAGEVHALIGENGAGKSTVGKMLAGAVRPTSGTITIDGSVLNADSVHDARQAGVSCAFQELSLVPDWTVGENLSLPDRSPLRSFSQKRSNRQAKELLHSLELEHIDPTAPVNSLALADRQLVEIARAISTKPRLLILDEASSALAPPGVQWLFRRIRELKASGTGVIYVSHRLSELAEIADRGTVLRDGRVVGEFTRGNWTENELISMMAGREASRHYPSLPPLPTDAGEPALRVENLQASGVNGVSLAIAPGEILGVGGLQGHGQAELLRALYGAIPAIARSWTIGGVEVKKLDPTRAVKMAVGYVPEDRKLEGLALGMGVGENLLSPWYRAFQLGGSPRLKREHGWIAGVLSALSVRTRGPREAAGALSGGNQQKLVFGKWTDRGRRLVLLHDPTRGIDVRAKQDLYGAITELAESGVGVLWFSTEVEELIHVCHRVVVLYEGDVVDELVGDRITADAIVGAAVGAKASNEN